MPEMDEAPEMSVGRPAAAPAPSPPASAPWYARVWDLVAAEPVAAQGVVQAGLVLGEAFGLHLAPEQIAAVNVFVAAILAVLLRRSVVPLARLPQSGDSQ